ncbi:hypothetical protein STEG23_015800, partial [Scotinomys teguina]
MIIHSSCSSRRSVEDQLPSEMWDDNHSFSPHPGLVRSLHSTDSFSTVIALSQFSKEKVIHTKVKEPNH